MQIECPLCEAPYDGPVVFGGNQFVVTCRQCQAEYGVGTEGIACSDVVWEEPTIAHTPVFDDHDQWLEEIELPRRDLPQAGIIRKERSREERRVIPGVEMQVLAPPSADRVFTPAPLPRRPAPPPTPSPTETVTPDEPSKPVQHELEVIAPEPTRPVAPRRRISPFIVAGFVGGLAVAAAAVWLFLPREAPPAEAPVVAQAEPEAAPETEAVEVEAKPINPGKLGLEVIGVEALPEQNAAVVFGTLMNDTEVPQTAIAVNVILTVDDVPRRRRGITCCDEFTLDQAKEVARAPTHVHYRQQRKARTIEAATAQDFAVVFPSVPAEQLKSKLGARIEISEATPGDGS